MKKKLKSTHCTALAFSISSMAGYKPVQTGYDAEGVQMIVEDLRDGQEYEVIIRPAKKLEN